jgi:opacity protein-like surface antigen
MTPFDANIDNDAGHAIDQDDLIAFHLHELSPQQERALHRVLRTNPTLQSESVAIATTLHAFPKHEPALPLDASALDRHWLALRNSLPLHVPPPIAPRSLFPRWAFPALAGAGLATIALLVALHYGRHTNPINNTFIATTQSPASTPNAVQLPAPSNTEPSSDSQHAALTPPSWIIARPSAPTSAVLRPEQPIAPGLPPTEPIVPQPPAQIFSATTTPPTTESQIPQPTTTAAQPSPTQLANPRAPAIHHTHTTDLTLAIFADITATNSSTSTSGSGDSLITQSKSQTASPAVGALVSFHQQFRPWLGYSVTATYFHPTFEYSNEITTPNGTYGIGPNLVNTLVYEVGGTYVVQGPHRGRLTTSVEAGASMLDFVPNANDSQTTSIRPAAIAGVGTQVALTKRFSLRAAYRAQIYKGPAFSDTNTTGTFTSTSTVFSSNAILGITYRFGKTGND